MILEHRISELQLHVSRVKLSYTIVSFGFGHGSAVWIPDRLDKRELQMNGRSRRTVYTASKLKKKILQTHGNLTERNRDIENMLGEGPKRSPPLQHGQVAAVKTVLRS